MNEQWTSMPDRAAAWDAHIELTTWLPLASSDRIEAPSQMLASAARIDRHLARVTAETLSAPLAEQVVRGRVTLARITAFQQPLDQWKAQQPQPLAVDAELTWPEYPALAAAERDAANHLRPLAGMLDTFARTGALHEPGQGWVRLGTEVLHTGAFLTLHRDQVIRPDGALGTYEHIGVADTVRVAAIDHQGRIAVVEDHCYLQGRLQLLPGGGVEPHEPPDDAARRECEEETGWRPGTLRLLAATHPLASATAATAHLYLGTDLQQGSTRRDPTERDMTVRWLPLPDAVRAVENGAILETASALGIVLAAHALAP
ncbi:NUDIX hydrolase [Streptomyces sp. NPDC049555]|uniref:NUDIX hydrolase n=1 Tax=Streptomyces sp. NPDC049555 TaxID=3154930 RepID=UPI00343408E1